MNSLKFEVSQVAGNIKCNLTTVKALAENKANMYKGIVVTEDTTKVAKEDIAELRKFQKDIDSARKQVKNEFIRPLTEFEDECKIVIALLEEPIKYMDEQVKEYELQKKKEKKEEITKIYNELTKDYEDYLPFSRFYKTQWENVSVSVKSIEKEINALVDQVSMAVEAIKATESEFIDKGLASLKNNLDVSVAMKEIKYFEAQKREILEREEKRKKLEEEQRQRQEEARIKEEENARLKAEEEAIKKAEYEKQMELEAEEFIGEEPFIEPSIHIFDEDPFIQEPLCIKKIYFIEETENKHIEIEEQLRRIGVKFESEVM